MDPDARYGPDPVALFDLYNSSTGGTNPGIGGIIHMTDYFVVKNVHRPKSVYQKVGHMSVPSKITPAKNQTSKVVIAPYQTQKLKSFGEQIGKGQESNDDAFEEAGNNPIEGLDTVVSRILAKPIPLGQTRFDELYKNMGDDGDDGDDGEEMEVDDAPEKHLKRSAPSTEPPVETPRKKSRYKLV